MPISQLRLTQDEYLAYYHFPGNPAKASVLFLGGFQSDMTGTKACYLKAQCEQHSIGFTAFDYFGHGLSSGLLSLGTIGLWKENALAILDQVTSGPVIVVGSSLGGWIGLWTALLRPERIQGLIGIAAAPDFTESLLWEQFTPAEKQTLLTEGKLYLPAEYCDGEYLITYRLIEEARAHLLLRRDNIPLYQPVVLLHGKCDQDVPYMTALELTDKLLSQEVRLHLIKNGDHRLSSPEALTLLWHEVSTMVERFSEVE